jgi:hypothetical protein
MNRHRFINRLQHDANNGGSLIMQNPDTNNDWHSAVVKYLISVSGPNNPKTMAAIKQIALIPLMGGQWRCPLVLNRYPVYFTYAHGYAIPTNRIFDLIAPNAEINPFQKQLFAHLGVQEASVHNIHHKIIDYDMRFAPGLETSCSHLQFLYLTAHLDREHDQLITYSLLKLTDNASTLRSLLYGK